MPRLGSWSPREGRECYDLDRLVDKIPAAVAAAGPRLTHNSMEDGDCSDDIKLVADRSNAVGASTRPLRFYNVDQTVAPQSSIWSQVLTGLLTHC